MRKKRYKKRISATRRFLLSVVAITMLVINIAIPLQVVLAEFMINEQWNDDGEGIIESEDEVSDDNAESTEDTSVDEPSNIQDDDSIPKEENTGGEVEENSDTEVADGEVEENSDTEVTDGEVEENSDIEVAENDQEELESSSVRNTVTINGSDGMGQLQGIIDSAGSTPTTINWTGGGNAGISNQINFTVRKGQDITINGEGFTFNGGASSRSLWYVEAGGVLTINDIDRKYGSTAQTYATVHGTLTIKNVDIDEMLVRSLPSANVTVASGGTFIMEESFIGKSKNVGDGMGGAVRVASNGTFIMNSSSIYDTEASNGGGVYVEQNANFQMNGGSMYNNVATQNGGAIYAVNYEDITISKEADFFDNRAKNTYEPPINAASVFPNIQTTNASIYGHPLNNRDINFTQTTRTLYITRNLQEGGAVTIEGNKNLSSGKVISGTDVTIVAQPAEGYVFTGWTSSNGGTFANASNASTKFTMPNNDTTITANFRIDGRKFIEIFPDEKLAKVIADYFKRGVEDYVTDAELLGVESVSGEGKGIKSLEGIENLQNLNYLSLATNNQLEDLAPISSLTKLRSLSITNCKVSDISPLENLVNLESLFMSNNQITSIAPLSSLTKLRRVEMANNKINDLRPLESVQSQLNTFNAVRQSIELEEVGVIGEPTTFNIYNIDGSTPAVNVSPGKYADGQLTWHMGGNRGGSWTGSNNFTGAFTQTVVPGTIFKFEHVPDVLEFEETSIPIQTDNQNDFMTIKRKESNWSLSVRDTRGQNSTWYIQVSRDAPFISEDGEHRLPDDALVFKGSDGQIKPLSNDPIEVYSGRTTSQSVTTEVSWKEDEGILVHMQTKAAKPDTRYQTSITWTLHNTPL